MMENFFAALTLQTIMIALGAVATGFIAGYMMRAAIVAKQKKKIHILEEEMLSSHARILELQKEMGEVKAANNNHPFQRKAELKVS